MNIILPYTDMYGCYGAFIYPNGEIEILKDKHEIFASSYVHNNLTSEQAILYDRWNLYRNKNHFDEFNTDFLFYVLGFDKITLSYNKRDIETTSFLPHMKYYEYYLRNWEINIYPPMIYDEKEHTFMYKPKDNNWTIKEWKDRTYEDEINELLLHRY